MTVTNLATRRPVEVARGQMLLEMQPMIAPEYVEGATIQERFEAFHRLNPWVLDALVRLTRTYVDAGHRRVGMKMLFEVLRYQYGIQTTGDEYRLNNNMTSRYARLLVQEHPELAPVFEVRQLQSA